jgi:hypothetical protein
LQLDEFAQRSCGLEFYLTHSKIGRVGPLNGGVGHPKKHKMTLFLQGGVAVAAKAGADADMLVRAKREVAAWVLACELDIDHLVPATVLRKMPATMSDATEVEGSAQVLWPRFSPAVVRGYEPANVDERVAWPIAAFDTLAANTDRKSDNWGVIDTLPHAVLIDHGHAFEDAATDSPFALALEDELLPPRLLSAIQRFTDGRDNSRLHGLLDDESLEGVFDRAAKITNERKLCV